MDDQSGPRRLLLVARLAPAVEAGCDQTHDRRRDQPEAHRLYAGKAAGGRYEPFIFEPDIGVDENDIEISDEMVLLRAADAIVDKEPPRLARIEIKPAIAASDRATRPFSASCSTSTAGPSRAPR